MTVIKLPADYKRDVIFPSMTSSFNESFIKEEKGAMRLPASLLVARGNAKASFTMANPDIELVGEGGEGTRF